MIKLTFLAFASLMLASSCQEARKIDDDEWYAYKQKHGKTYASARENAFRRSIYSKNKAIVDEFNTKMSDKLGYRRGLNHLSDLTEAERRSLNGFLVREQDKHRLQNTPDAQQFLDAILNDRSEVPDELDWRKVEGRVSRVKNQFSCGSCWAFSTIGVLEGQEAVINKSLILDGKPTLLSEQNLIDCDHSDFGCSGGWMKSALEFIHQQGGIEASKDYRYEAQNGTCKFEKSKVVFTDSGAAILPEGDEQKLKEVVAKFGPVAVAIDADDMFQMYGGGIYDSDDCHNSLDELNHAVLVVGFGTNIRDGDFWIVKNSWGTRWGEDGYIRMSRNKKNQCGIATIATIPTFS